MGRLQLRHPLYSICMSLIGITLNNALDYLTNGLYRTPNPNHSPYMISRFREIRSSKSASGFDLAVSAAK